MKGIITPKTANYRRIKPQHRQPSSRTLIALPIQAKLDRPLTPRVIRLENFYLHTEFLRNLLKVRQNG